MGCANVWNIPVWVGGLLHEQIYCTPLYTQMIDCFSGCQRGKWSGLCAKFFGQNVSALLEDGLVFTFGVQA